jgi:ubiquinone/menaquinone biosynthesis C-methylase UbiE
MFVFRFISMPIFRDYPNQSAARKARLDKARLTRAQTDGYSRKVFRKKSFDWTTRASFSEVDAMNRGQISAAIKEVSLKNPNRKLNILDWGCGDGTAAKQVAQNKKLNVFGFSIDSSEGWLKPEGVTFLHTATEVLPVFLKKKKIKLDVVYGYASFKHLPSFDHQIQALNELSPVLNKGARVFPDPIYFEPRYVRSLEQSGYSVEVYKNFIVSLTKVN